ncbi:LysR family transcriptional regulator [Bradyrhizobium sp. sGM-13]|uniref:LysR family transcriptional regulator n=1 Tax=Bradyrhizobium sp. sGM-13 TaxID=2831781 RepID=UPI001BCB5CE0|nr:LysR family transcriptional regulator [Bradyrhizobium sp. sGM-13]
MDLRRARTFVAVAELGTVSNAALHLRVAQPALSRRIADLERELGFRLFDRVGRGLVLTGEGEQLLVDCRGLLSYAETLDERAQLLRRGDRGVLKVAASPQFIEGILADFLHHYAKLFPNVQVRLREAMGWPEIKELLERGDIHLGQNLANATQPEKLPFESFRLESVELLLAFQPKLAPGTRNTLEINCLAGLPLLLLDTSYVFRRTFDAACQLAGVVPTIAFESRTPHTLVAMAEAGHGLAVLPSTMRMRTNRLRVVRLTFRQKRLREPLAIFWGGRRPLPRYGTAFCRALGDHTRSALLLQSHIDRSRV